MWKHISPLDGDLANTLCLKDFTVGSMIWLITILKHPCLMPRDDVEYVGEGDHEELYLILLGFFRAHDLHLYDMVECDRIGMIQQLHKKSFCRLVWDLGIDVGIAWGQAISGREDCNVSFSGHWEKRPTS